MIANNTFKAYIEAVCGDVVNELVDGGLSNDDIIKNEEIKKIYLNVDKYNQFNNVAKLSLEQYQKNFVEYIDHIRENPRSAKIGLSRMQEIISDFINKNPYSTEKLKVIEAIKDCKEVDYTELDSHMQKGAKEIIRIVKEATKDEESEVAFDTITSFMQAKIRIMKRNIEKLKEAPKKEMERLKQERDMNDNNAIPMDYVKNQASPKEDSKSTVQKIEELEKLEETKVKEKSGKIKDNLVAIKNGITTLVNSNITIDEKLTMLKNLRARKDIKLPNLTESTKEAIFSIYSLELESDEQSVFSKEIINKILDEEIKKKEEERSKISENNNSVSETQQKLLSDDEKALLNAVKNNNIQVIEDLYPKLKGKIKPIKDPETGYNVFHIAAQKGYYDIIGFFIDREQALINEQANDGSTPIICAVRGNNSLDKSYIHIINLLLENFANPFIKDNSGNTAFSANIGKKAAFDVDGLLRQHSRALNDKFFTALDKSKFEEADLWLSRGANVDELIASGSKYIPLLYAASSAGREDIVEYLLSKNAKAEIYDRENDAIHLVAEKGHIAIIELLISKGASINSQDKKGNTPLHIAVIKKDIKLIQYLLSKKDMLNYFILNDEDKMPSNLIDSSTSKEIKEILNSIVPNIDYLNDIMTDLVKPGSFNRKCKKEYRVKKAFNIDDNSDINKQIIESAKLGDTRRFERLFPSIKDNIENIIDEEFGGNALHWAANNGNYDIVSLILSYRRDLVELKTKKKQSTPLINAVQNGHEETVGLLLANYANPSVVNTEGKDAYQYAINNTRIIGALNKHRKMINGKFFTALNNRQSKDADLWLSRGADVNQSIDFGSKYVPLLYAAAVEGRDDIVEYLLSKNAKAEINNSKYTPIHGAAERGHEHIIKILVANKVSINSQNSEKNTVLHILVSKGYIKAIESVLETYSDRINLNIKNSKEFTPEDLVSGLDNKISAKRIKQLFGDFKARKLKVSQSEDEQLLNNNSSGQSKDSYFMNQINAQRLSVSKDVHIS